MLDELSMLSGLAHPLTTARFAVDSIGLDAPGRCQVWLSCYSDKGRPWQYIADLGRAASAHEQALLHSALTPYRLVEYLRREGAIVMDQF